MQYPHYRKELPQMPMHKGKETGRKGGTYNGGQDKGEKVNFFNIVTNNLARTFGP